MELVLGTAQFGMDYGVTNCSGMCSLETIEEILDLAFSCGITKLDTAVSYGKSEENLGMVGVERFKVDSKIPFLENYQDGDLERLCSGSLKRLGLASLDTLYLHDQRDVQSLEILSALESLKSTRQINKIGASVYALDVPDMSLKSFDFVQCQGNAFDSKYLGYLNQGFSVNLRSIFLQGLLLAHLDDLPSFLSPYKELFFAWEKYCGRHGKSKLEMSLYNVMNYDLDGYVVGASSVNEFEQIVMARASASEIRDIPLFSYGYVNEYVIDPRRWNR
jgi:aryl-alcohol dehydrogenase-like predicted oxidoreductase